MLSKKNLLHVNITEENIEDKPIYNLCIRFKYMKPETENQKIAYSVFNYYTIIKFDGFLEYFKYPPYEEDYIVNIFEELELVENLKLFKDVCHRYDEIPKKVSKRFKAFDNSNKNTLKDYDYLFDNVSKEIEIKLKEFIINHKDEFCYVGTLEV